MAIFDAVNEPTFPSNVFKAVAAVLAVSVKVALLDVELAPRAVLIF